MALAERAKDRVTGVQYRGTADRDAVRHDERSDHDGAPDADREETAGVGGARRPPLRSWPQPPEHDRASEVHDGKSDRGAVGETGAEGQSAAKPQRQSP